MTNFEPVSAADVQLMQGLAQRVTAILPDLVNCDATFGELAWTPPRSPSTPPTNLDAPTAATPS